MKSFNDGRDWFLQRRFGLFIHWGIYSLGGKSEWERQLYQVPLPEYDRYIPRFTAEKFNPDVWIDAALATGMEYLAFTTKHHDGFCMWDTAETDYNVMHTPCGRDVLRELADACHRRDFPLVLYHSCLDWHHPAYANSGRFGEIKTDPAAHDMPAYIAYLKAQVRELCTRYGKIHGWWWDMNTSQYCDPSVNALIRELQPGCVINNRGFDDTGDFFTPERAGADGDAPFTVPTEACDSVTCSGWCCQPDGDYHSAHYFKRSIAGFLAKGANYLLNVGPNPDGTLPERSLEILRRVGPWFKRVRPALVAPYQRWLLYRKDILCTGADDTLCFIMLNPLDTTTQAFIPLDTPAVEAELLNTGDPLETAFRGASPNKEPVLIVRNIPVEKLTGDIPVIRVRFGENISAVAERAARHYYAW